jgi:glutamate transport system substrate-binding protein
MQPLRLIIKTATLLALSFSASAALAQQFPAGSTMEQLAKAGTVRIGVKFDQPLFGQRNLQGKPEGLDVEIGKMIASKLGIDHAKINWIETVSANREAFIQQNKVDMVIATYFITPKRQEVATFAGPYFITGQDLLVKKGNPAGITGPESLDGKKLCVLNGSEGRNIAAKAIPKAELVGFDTFSKCAEAVKSGSVDAATLSAAVMMGYVSKEPNAFQLVGKRFSDEPWGVGVQKGDVAFCEFINNTLKDAEKDGRYQSAFAATVGKFSPEKPALPKFIACS